MISSVSGISNGAAYLHLNRREDRGTPTLDDETFAKGFVNHDRAHADKGDARSEEKKKPGDPKELSPEEKAQVEELKKRDAQVRAHEMAHMAAAGNLAQSGPNYEYQTGPDGRTYAIGGNVQIDTSAGRTPEETLAKAAQIRAAALAPADPSPQDMKVASAADRLASEAQQKIAKERQENPPEETRPTSESTNGAQDASKEISFKFASELTRFDAEDSEQSSSSSDTSAIERQRGPGQLGERFRRAYGPDASAPYSEPQRMEAFA